MEKNIVTRDGCQVCDLEICCQLAASFREFPQLKSMEFFDDSGCPISWVFDEKKELTYGDLFKANQTTY
jgi:hypothetical protein